MVLGAIFGVFLSAYYAYRGFVKSYVGYLGFDIKEVLKISDAPNTYRQRIRILLSKIKLPFVMRKHKEALNG